MAVGTAESVGTDVCVGAVDTEGADVGVDAVDTVGTDVDVGLAVFVGTCVTVGSDVEVGIVEDVEVRVGSEVGETDADPLDVPDKDKVPDRDPVAVRDADRLIGILRYAVAERLSEDVAERVVLPEIDRVWDALRVPDPDGVPLRVRDEVAVTETDREEVLLALIVGVPGGDRVAVPLPVPIRLSVAEVVSVRDPRFEADPDADPLPDLESVVDRDGVPDLLLYAEPDGEPLEERVVHPVRDPLADMLPLLDTDTELVVVSVCGELLVPQGVPELLPLPDADLETNGLRVVDCEGVWVDTADGRVLPVRVDELLLVLLPDPVGERDDTPDLDPEELPLVDRVAVPLLDAVEVSVLLRVDAEEREPEAEGERDRVADTDPLDDLVDVEVLEEEVLWVAVVLPVVVLDTEDVTVPLRVPAEVRLVEEEAVPVREAVLDLEMLADAVEVRELLDDLEGNPETVEVLEGREESVTRNEGIGVRVSNAERVEVRVEVGVAVGSTAISAPWTPANRPSIPKRRHRRI